MGSEGRRGTATPPSRTPIRKGLFDSLLLLLAFFLLWESADYARMARAFPRLVLLLMVAMILLDMAWDFVKASRRPRGDDFPTPEEEPNTEGTQGEAGPTARRRGRVLLCVLLMFAFPACLMLLGFLPGSVAFFLLAAWSLGYRHRNGLALSSAAVAGLLYVVFVWIMKSRLPVGLVVHWVSR